MCYHRSDSHQYVTQTLIRRSARKRIPVLCGCTKRNSQTSKLIPHLFLCRVAAGSGSGTPMYPMVEGFEDFVQTKVKNLIHYSTLSSPRRSPPFRISLTLSFAGINPSFTIFSSSSATRAFAHRIMKSQSSFSASDEFLVKAWSS